MILICVLFIQHCSFVRSPVTSLYFARALLLQWNKDARRVLHHFTWVEDSVAAMPVFVTDLYVNK